MKIDMICKVNKENLFIFRPFERSITLHKDSTGHVGFQYKEGEIRAIVVGSSAARNGLLINHNMVEVLYHFIVYHFINWLK